MALLPLRPPQRHSPMASRVQYQSVAACGAYRGHERPLVSCSCSYSLTWYLVSLNVVVRGCSFCSSGFSLLARSTRTLIDFGPRTAHRHNSTAYMRYISSCFTYVHSHHIHILSSPLYPNRIIPRHLPFPTPSLATHQQLVIVRTTYVS